VETKIHPPEHWHRRAAELRFLATEPGRDPDSRSLLKQIAHEYDLLAKRAEGRLKDYGPASLSGERMDDTPSTEITVRPREAVASKPEVPRYFADRK
jgi:hypothetical protein